LKLARASGSAGPPAPVTPPMPPLLFAAKAGSLEAMKALVAAGANPKFKAKDGTTLALAAAYGGRLDAMKYALELDPDINAKATGGQSILHIALMNKLSPEPQDVILFLADKGAKLDARNDRGGAPADLANQSSPEPVRVFYVQLLKDRKVAPSTNH